MRNLARLLPLTLLATAACSSSSGRTFVTFDPDTGSADSTAIDSARDSLPDVPEDSRVDGATDSTMDSLQTADAADAAETFDTAASADSAADATDAGPAFPACVLPAKIGDPSSLAPASTARDDLLGGITPDERTIVWESVDASGNVTVYVADRISPAVPFGAPAAVATPADGFLKGRVAISPDGLRLVFVSKNGKKLEQVTRSSAGSAFAVVDVTPFATVNALTTDVGFELSDPVVTADDRGLYFLLKDPGGSRIRWSTRATATDAWPGGAMLTSAALLPTGTQLVRPTGASADGRILFVWSEAMATTLAVTRANVSSPFGKSDDLGPLEYLTVNTNCSAVYHSATLGSADLDLVVAH